MHIIDYAIRKSKRVVRPVMGGEVYAFMDAFEMAYVIKVDLERMMGAHQNLMLTTDSKHVFHAVTCGKRTSERRLSLDITVARQSYHNF